MTKLEIQKLFTLLNLNRNYFKDKIRITPECDEYMKKSVINHDQLFKRDQILALADFIIKYHSDCMRRVEYKDRNQLVDVEHETELLVFTKEEFEKIADYIKNQL